MEGEIILSMSTCHRMFLFRSHTGERPYKSGLEEKGCQNGTRRANTE